MVEQVKIIVPLWIQRKMDKDPNWCGGCIGHDKLKKTYDRSKLISKIGKKEVKYWKQVYLADDSEGDEFIPIYKK